MFEISSLCFVGGCASWIFSIALGMAEKDEREQDMRASALFLLLLSIGLKLTLILQALANG